MYDSPALLVDEVVDVGRIPECSRQRVRRSAREDLDVISEAALLPCIRFVGQSGHTDPPVTGCEPIPGVPDIYGEPTWTQIPVHEQDALVVHSPVSGCA